MRPAGSHLNLRFKAPRVLRHIWVTLFFCLQFRFRNHSKTTPFDYLNHHRYSARSPADCSPEKCFVCGGIGSGRTPSGKSCNAVSAAFALTATTQLYAVSRRNLATASSCNESSTDILAANHKFPATQDEFLCQPIDAEKSLWDLRTRNKQPALLCQSTGSDTGAVGGF